VRAAALLAAGWALSLAACEPAAAPAPASAAPPADAADPESRAVLDRIVRAESTLAYHGLRTVSRGPAGASRETRFRLVHHADGRTLVEWTPVGEGARRRWSTGSRYAWVARPELLVRNYRVTEDPAPVPPVAWREARRVRIEGRRPGRPSLDLLVDAETSLVLAETGRTFDGEEWMRARFEALDVGEPADPVAAAEGEDLGDACGAEPPAGLVPLAVTALPAGFERLCSRTSGCGAWVEDFGDGLAAVSVLQRVPATAGPASDEVRRSRSPGGGTLSGRVDGVEVTVSGNLPDADLMTVYRGLAAPVPAR
jgi:hypothetical protein